MKYFNDRFNLNYIKPTSDSYSVMDSDFISRLASDNPRDLREFVTNTDLRKLATHLKDKILENTSVMDANGTSKVAFKYTPQLDYSGVKFEFEDYPMIKEAEHVAEEYYRNLTVMNAVKDIIDADMVSKTDVESINRQLMDIQKQISFHVAQKEALFLKNTENAKSILSKNVAVMASMQAQQVFLTDDMSKHVSALKILPHIERHLHDGIKSDPWGMMKSGHWWDSPDSPSAFNLGLALNMHKQIQYPDPDIMNFGYRINAFQSDLPNGFYAEVQDALENMKYATLSGSQKLRDTSLKILSDLGVVARQYDYGRNLSAEDEGSLGYLLATQAEVFATVTSSDPASIQSHAEGLSRIVKSYEATDTEMMVSIAQQDPYNAIVDPISEAAVRDHASKSIEANQGEEYVDKPTYDGFSTKPPAWMIATMWADYKTHEHIRSAMEEFNKNMNDFTYHPYLFDENLERINLEDAGFCEYVSDRAPTFEPQSTVDKLSSGLAVQSSCPPVLAEEEKEEIKRLENDVMMATLLHHDAPNTHRDLRQSWSALSRSYQSQVEQANLDRIRLLNSVDFELFEEFETTIKMQSPHRDQDSEHIMSSPPRLSREDEMREDVWDFDVEPLDSPPPARL